MTFPQILFFPVTCFFLVCLAPFTAWALTPEDLRLEGSFQQGGLVRGYAPPEAILYFAGRRLRVGPDGLFVIGFGRDAASRASLEVASPGKARQRVELSVAQREYQTQRIDGLPPKMVVPSKEDLARIQRENARVATARLHDSPQAFFIDGFDWPLQGRISGVYGSQRILNGKPRRPHYGLDIAAPTGTPVRAPAAGIVTLTATDMYYTGGTVLMDHGYGVSSTFIHLSKLLVKEGDEVARGQVIGEVGATGRATGPHLDWRINLFNIRLDPALAMDGLPGPVSP